MEESADLLPRAELRAIFTHLRSRAVILISVFFLSFIVGYPMAEWMIEILLDADGYRPVGVEIIVLQPMEIILLKLRIASQIALAALITTLVCDLAMNGRKIIADGKRVSIETSAGGYSRLLFAIFCIIFLGLLGFVYAHEILIPFLLDYLATDAGTAGLDSTWQLRSWIGFIMGLYIGSIVSFQIPLVLVILIRAGLMDRNTLTDNRSFLWFVAAVFGAFVSPPDPLSMFLIGGPMLVILEIALLLERITGRN
ncbi:MAG: twin-arginine translocase subunit TatC [Candidatus Thalassarchaeaceae archaeon]